MESGTLSSEAYTAELQELLSAATSKEERLVAEPASDPTSHRLPDSDA
jgi:hypothetical protein